MDDPGQSQQTCTIQNECIKNGNMVISMDGKGEEKRIRTGKCEAYCAWTDKITQYTWFSITWTIIRIIMVLTFMYFLICSLNLMSDAFRLMAGVKMGRIFRENTMLQNPLVDLMIGTMVTMALQSGETLTAIMISMVAANVIPIDNAIYVLFGAEVGSSITIIVVSFGHITDRTDFRRAFSASTMHSIFNWFSVIIFFPIELSTHALHRCAAWIADGISPQNTSSTDKQFFSAIIKPFTRKIIHLNQDLVSQLSTRRVNETQHTTLITPGNGFLFSGTKLEDVWVGVILLVSVLITLFLCLAGIIKTMNSMLGSHLASAIKRYINTDLPGKFKPFTAYIFMMVAALMTAILQSSTVFTSSLTPMVGIGLIPVERVFPLILGANIGSGLGNILGALAQDPHVVKLAMTLALVQILFNTAGMLLFYPLPLLRYMVIKTGKWLGRNTCKYRWFGFVYILTVFVLIPLIGICISMGGIIVTYCVGIPLGIIVVVISIINALQCQKPQLLPKVLQTWDWLPEWMHSLDPYDKWLSKIGECCTRYTRRGNRGKRGSIFSISSFCSINDGEIEAGDGIPDIIRKQSGEMEYNSTARIEIRNGTDTEKEENEKI